MIRSIELLICFFLASFATVPAVWAGQTDPPSAPNDASGAMYTLETLYNRLDTGAAGSLRTGGFSGPGPVVAPSGHDLNEIMGKMPQADMSAGAAVNHVVKDRTFWGLRTDGNWGLAAGSLETRTIDPSSPSQPAGFYSAFDLSAADPDLKSSNILSGKTVFGVTGSVPGLTGNAGAGDVLAGKTFSNSGNAGVSGTMVNRGAVSYTPCISDQTVERGWHNGAGIVKGDSNLTAANIRANVEIFGVGGTSGSAVPEPNRYTLEVDGSSGQRVVSDTPVTLGNFSLDAWFKTNDKGGVLLSASQGGAGDAGFTVSLDTNDNINVVLTNGSVAKNLTTTTGINNQSFPKGIWHHLAFTFDNSGSGMLKVYINGEKELLTGTDNAVTGYNETVKLNLGTAQDLSTGLAACFDTVRVWDGVLTGGEISRAMNSSTPVASANRLLDWRFEEGSGSSVSDSSGNYISGSLTGCIFSDQFSLSQGSERKLSLMLPGAHSDNGILFYQVTSGSAGAFYPGPWTGNLVYTGDGNENLTFEISDGLNTVSKTIHIARE